MKSLLLMRHAKSSWKSSAASDFERPLNGRGRRDAPFMAQQLLRRGIRPDLVISSAAARAVSTALIVVKELGIDPKRIRAEMGIYEATTLELLRIIRSIPNEAQSVLLVGHNPGLSECAAALTLEKQEELPTSAILCLRFSADSWEGVSDSTGTVRFFDYPKKHAHGV